MPLRYVIVAFLLSGCSGFFADPPPPDLSAESCVLSFTGSAKGEISCSDLLDSRFGKWDRTRDLGILLITANIDNPNGGTFSLEVFHPGRPTIGKWSSTTDEGAMAIGIPSEQKTWIASAGPTGDIGSWEIDLTACDRIGGEPDAGTSDELFAIHGTLQATMIGQGMASGTTELHGRF